MIPGLLLVGCQWLRLYSPGGSERGKVADPGGSLANAEARSSRGSAWGRVPVERRRALLELLDEELPWAVTFLIGGKRFISLETGIQCALDGKAWRLHVVEHSERSKRRV